MRNYRFVSLTLASLLSVTGSLLLKSNFSWANLTINSTNSQQFLLAETQQSPFLEKMEGTNADDKLVGKNIPYIQDVIYGYEGNDFIEGLAGQDKLYGGRGNDEIHGGLNRDFLEGGAGQDELYGDEGNDIISGDDNYIHDSVKEEQNDLLIGGLGDDELYSRQGTDTLIGWGGGSEEVDFLQGSTNPNDQTIFVLGNQESGVFYAKNSNHDFALIQHLEKGNVVQLLGSPDDYQLVEIVHRPRKLTLVGNVIGIVYKPTDDLIAIMQSYKNINLDTDMANSDLFMFVQ